MYVNKKKSQTTPGGKFRSKTSKSGKRGKVMFDSDIANARNAEQARTNRANEGIRREANRIQEKSVNAQIAKTAIEGALGKKGVAGTLISHIAPTSIVKGFNDPAWYQRDVEFTTSSAGIALNIPSGLPLNLTDDRNLSALGAVQFTYLNMWGNPGIAETDTLSNFAQEHGTDPINYMAKIMYVKVRAAARRRLQYTPADITRYIVCLTSAYQFILEAARAYKIFNTFYTNNRNYYMSLSSICGYDITNDNCGEWLFNINRAIKALASYVFPKDMYILARKAFLAERLICDDEGISKSPIIIPVMANVYVWHQSSDPNDHMIAENISLCDAWNRKQLTLKEFNDIINRLLIGLNSNADTLTLLADITTAVGEGNVINLELLDANWTFSL